MSTEENNLIVIKPGEYIRAGRTGPAKLKIKEPTQGLVVKEVPESSRTFLTVLVDGHLVNVWKTVGKSAD